MITRSTPQDRAYILWRGIIPGICFSLATLVAGLNFLTPGTEENFPTVSDRVIYTLKWQTFTMLSLLLGIMRVILVRIFTKAMDPIYGKSEHLIMVYLKNVQNTVEQALLSVTGQLILSTYISPSFLTRVVPVLVTLFVIGRILFYIGYMCDPKNRAFGFALSWLPNLYIYSYCIYCFFVY